MRTLRFILAFAEILLSPAILLYLLAAPKAIHFRRLAARTREYRAAHAG